MEHKEHEKKRCYSLLKNIIFARLDRDLTELIKHKNNTKWMKGKLNSIFLNKEASQT